MYQPALHKKFLPILLLSVVVLLVLLLPLDILANENDGTAAENLASSWLYQIFIGLGGMFVWLFGNLLDLTIHYLVLDFGRLLTENLGVAVDTIWQTVRDTINVAFIFVLIWIGMKTILNADDSGLRKQLAYLIAAALLINFSLFIAKAVVDFSNIAAVQISQAFVIEQTGSGNVYNVIGENGGNFIAPEGTNTQVQKSVSGAFMEATKLSSFAGNLVVEGENIGSIVASVFMTFVMMVVMAFVFAAGAILLITRFVVLVVTLMLSPMMFLGWIYPGLSGFSKEWTQTFLQNAFVAPAYLFMLYIALAVIGDGDGGFGFNPAGSIADSTSGGALDIVLYFSIVIALLLASIKVASEMSTHGSSAVVRVGYAGGRAMRGLAMSPVNYSRNLGRNVGGGVASTIRRNTPLFGGNASRAAARNLQRSQQRVREGTATTGDRARIAYQNVRGAGSTSDRLATLQASANRSIGGGRSANEVATETNARNQAQANAARVTSAAGLGLGLTSPGVYDNLRRANKQELQTIYQQDPATLLQPRHYMQLTEDQVGLVNELTNEGTISTNDRDAIVNGRSANIQSLSQGNAAGGHTRATYFGNMSPNAIAGLSGSILENLSNSDQLQIRHLVAIMNNKAVSSNTRHNIKSNIIARANSGAPPEITEASTWLQSTTGPGANF